jgi:hypothetical protein
MARAIWSNPAYEPMPVDSIPGSKKQGWRRRLVGTPLALQRSRKYFRLVYNDQVDVRILLANLNLSPELGDYVGKKTEICGWPSRRKMHYPIMVRHPHSLRVLRSD